jgi:hypothetical protein
VLIDGRLVEEDALDRSEATSYMRVSGRQVPVESRVSEETTAGPSGKTHHVGRYATSARLM